MPATEQTWYNQKLLHVIFGATGVLMLLCTLWMLAADHNREWKVVQRQFRNLESYTAASRLSGEESAEYYLRQRQLKAQVEEAQSEAPPRELIDEFKRVANQEAHNGYNVDRIDNAYEQLVQAHRTLHPESSDGQSDGDATLSEDDRKELIDLRRDLLSALQDVLSKARQDEDNKQRNLKFKRAELDGRRSEYDIAVANGIDEVRQRELEERVQETESEVSGKLLPLAQNAKNHRVELQKLFDRVMAPETAARKTLSDHEAEVARLEAAFAERSNTARKRILELPVIDAFGRPLKIDNIWLPQLTWNNNFRDVARYDRCTTCHQGIDRTAPGSAVAQGYASVERLEVTLATPEAAPEITEEQQLHIDGMKNAANKGWFWQRGELNDAASEQELQYKLSNAYGLQLGRQGTFAANDVTVTVVRPRSPAANARIEPGDVIEQINDVKLLDRTRAITYLLKSVDWGKPLVLHLRRGTPQPFTSHPRLDLYVGSLSPHKLGEMGCTVCHDGQGSATQFKWASHTPNTPVQAEAWHGEHGWFNNHNWLFPMMPKRFNESLCLKCHHDVVELAASDRFPDPPAPKLMAGHHTIEKFGCFGCHEINGWDGPTRRRGPDLRAEPMYFAAAQQLLIDPGLSDRERELAQEVISGPERHEARKLLAESIRADAALVPAAGAKEPQVTEKTGSEVAADEALDAAGDEPASAPEQARLTAESHKLATILGADDATPGEYRKVGPSLRYVGQKVDFDFLYSWIKNPTDFRPSTRMPRFFGLWDHLVPEQAVDDQGRPKFRDATKQHPVMAESPGLAEAKRFEPVEIRAIAEYLLDQSQPFDYAEYSEGVTEEPSAERGKQVFQARGCLACHQHRDFPEAKQTQGPDLSRIAAKLKGERGERWLYSWVREPNRYHARTVMPNVFLLPVEGAGGAVSDPARDVTAYLLSSQADDWAPQAPPELNPAALDELTKIYLSASFSDAQIEGKGGILEDGIASDLAADIKGDERMLLRGDDWSKEKFERQKLLYLGRRSISRLGCTGCHDIPGFEDAKPIGTGLADWGRKDTSKLAFEMIVEYLRERPPGESHRHHAGEHAVDDEDHAHEAAEHHLDPTEMDPDTGFFVEALLHHQREGFMWQKLREPRSYDFKKTENKSYVERLRMPKFNFDQQQIEEVMTFVLGLVAEPPAAKYVYGASPRRKAVVEGERLLAKYNCVGCHAVKTETWEFDYDPTDPTFAEAPKVDEYEFLVPHFTPQELEESKKVDRRGLGHAVVHGTPVPVTDDHEPDEPIYFTLYQPAAINGQTWLVGGPEVPVMEQYLTKKREAEGGDFARYLHPVAVAIGQEENPNVKPSDVWGWVPPPLVREGQKVQTGWLHDFLLNPYPIRPAIVAGLRMPKFNMSSDEAEKLVHYFAAVDDADYPYQYHRSGGEDYMPEREYRRIEQALKVVTDNNYCVKCHLVGDFRPKGSAAALAPNLDRVYQRLRPSYVLEWVANPKRKLPYTGMPVNFPPHNDPNAKLRESLFPGESEDALRGVVGLLLNYDAYLKHQTSIKSMVKEPPPEPAAGQRASAR